MTTTESSLYSKESLKTLYAEVAKVMIGRHKEIKLFLTAILAGGHILLEDMPGTGKTTLVKTFARAMDCSFKRIQCVPDLLPGDVTGVSVFHPQKNEFTFRPGPVFTNVLLVDEINRALPRTQSSLLESMEERQVSVEGQTYSLASPFMVLATQNPIEMEGTFPLPEAQLDRFLMRLKLGYPTPEEEQKMLAQVGDDLPFDDVQPVIHPQQLNEWKEAIRHVFVHSSIITYITALAQATRQHPLVSVGASPRASKALYKTVKTWAFLNGRDHVLPDDVQHLLSNVWNHRLVINAEARMTDVHAEDVLTDILHQVPLPKENVIRQ